ncbi:uncharacterized protein BN759_00422 [Bacteroides sp. CAG:702]|nr:uncharacterized protein BN759_00422 [Bacteroides sp. CAG:702]
MKQVKLAIIIPAYKEEFLAETLESLANQTNMDFNVYVGDDCSPFDLGKIVDSFQDKLSVSYTRFSNNLGKTNLIAHWNRCLDLLQEEEYFCLFSDDDVMESRCVEAFYQSLETSLLFDVYHFNIHIIDEYGNLIRKCPDYPERLSSIDFFKLLYTSQIDARMPEFIFNTRHFRLCKGFVGFDLAFRSDNATVMSCAQDKGIYTIPLVKVLWRDSGKNISSDRNVSIEIKYRKAKATIAFCYWLNAFLLGILRRILSQGEKRESWHFGT